MKNESKAVAIPQPQSETGAIVSLIERAARDPSVDIDKLQRLLDLRTQIEAKAAEAAFDAALNEAQSEMQPVSRDSANPQTRSRYASYTALDQALRPIYTKHGFSLSFNTVPGAAELFVRVTCRVAKGGYSRDYQIDMPADGKGARGNDVMTRTHATGSAVSYGMRYLLKMIFNVTFGEYDDDGNAAGKRAADKPIAPERTPTSPVQPAAVAPPPSCDPVTGEVGPRAIEVENDERGPLLLKWGQQYVAAIVAATTLAELDAWGAANNATLRKVKDEAPKIFDRIVFNISDVRTKLMNAAPAPEEIEPPPAPAKVPAKHAVGTYKKKKAEPKVPTPDQPEEYLAYLGDTLHACNTAADLQAVWQTQFLNKLGEMFPPDAAIAMRTFEARLAELAEKEAV